MKKNVLSVMAVYGLIGTIILPQRCYSATSTSTFQVTATVTDTCTVSATNLTFSYNGTTGGGDASTAVATATCSNGTDYFLTLSTGSSGTYANRTMLNGTNTLNYNLFIDAANTQIWGDGTGVSVTNPANAPTNTFFGNGTAQNYTIYGKIASPAQNVPVGTYTDTGGITITVNF